MLGNCVLGFARCRHSWSLFHFCFVLEAKLFDEGACGGRVVFVGHPMGMVCCCRTGVSTLCFGGPLSLSDGLFCLLSCLHGLCSLYGAYCMG